MFLFAGKPVDVKSETLLNNHFFIIFFSTKMLWVHFMTCVLKYLPGPILDINIGYSFIVYLSERGSLQTVKHSSLIRAVLASTYSYSDLVCNATAPLVCLLLGLIVYVLCQNCTM